MSVCAIVLAAGKGTRMKSAMPKVLHEVYFKPMVHHVLNALLPLGIEKTLVVTGHCHEQVERALAGWQTEFVYQERQLGTGHAVLACEQKLRNFSGTVLILCGDTPLVTSETLHDLLSEHEKGGSVLTVVTTLLDDPTNYGRIVCDDDGTVLAIVEEKDATSAQKEIREINAGIYCVDAKFLFDALSRVGTDNNQGEMYLTDIVGIAVRQHKDVQKYICRDSKEILGVNSRQELSIAHGYLQHRYLAALMESGVTVVQPETVTVEGCVRVGKDTVISPNTYITGTTVIGQGVFIHPFVRVENCIVEDGAVLESFCYLKDITVMK